MAIGALLGNEQHSFMHDIESFFWVLFWICIHYNGPGESRVVATFDKWNYDDPEELAVSKRGVIADEGDFLELARQNFTIYHQPLIPCVNWLRREILPNGERWKIPDQNLYTKVSQILRDVWEKCS